jgi:hypothetical protein
MSWYPDQCCPGLKAVDKEFTGYRLVCVKE